MVWEPKTLTLNELDPPQGEVSDKPISGQAIGAGFSQGVQLLLIRSGALHLTVQDVVPCNNVRIVEGNFKLKFQMNLEQVTPGTYDALVWNPPLRKGDPNERYVLEKAFTVQG